MSKGTIFNLLRYLAMSVAEQVTQQLSKEELNTKLVEEDFILDNKTIDCAYTLYLKYIDEYKAEVEYKNAI